MKLQLLMKKNSNARILFFSMFERIKEKGYAQISTNLGDLNIELFCQESPRACYNFIGLVNLFKMISRPKKSIIKTHYFIV